MLPPTANGFGAGVGVQVIVPPPGTVLTLHAGSAAGLGPVLVQITVPLIVLPAAAEVGKPEIAACMSARGAIVSGSVSVLLAGAGSVVLAPAVVVIDKVPVAGAVKVLEHTIVLPADRGFGAGLGVQLWIAPGGSPLSAHVGAAAALGPALVHVPLTVTGWPAMAEVGTEVLACMSARAAGVCEALAVLLAGTGSAVELPAAPVTVTVPLGGTV
jgi:hypothetical protein